jgi:hypothetical protein
MDETHAGHEQTQELVVAKVATTDLAADIRGAIAANIATERSEPAQIALSRFAALIDQLPPRDLEKVGAQIGSILPALTSEKPNVVFAERAIVNIQNTLLKAHGGIHGAFYRITNGSPIVAVYFALVCSLVSFLILLAIFDLLASRHKLPMFVLFAGPEFMTTVTFGFLGAMVSIAFRLDTTEIERVGLIPLYLTSLIKPYIGAMFGLIVYCILQTKIISIAGINDNPVQTLEQVQSYTAKDRIWAVNGEVFTVHDYLLLFMSALVGFLSGFSERFAADLLDKSSRAFMGGAPARTEVRAEAR